MGVTVLHRVSLSLEAVCTGIATRSNVVSRVSAQARTRTLVVIGETLVECHCQSLVSLPRELNNQLVLR